MKATVSARLWSAWNELARPVGDFQARLILTVFYFTVAAPFGLIVRTIKDPLTMRRRPAQTGWIKRKRREHDITAARRQY